MSRRAHGAQPRGRADGTARYDSRSFYDGMGTASAHGERAEQQPPYTNFFTRPMKVDGTYKRKCGHGGSSTRLAAIRILQVET